VEGVDDSAGYTFAGGDLAGKTARNGDAMLMGATLWTLHTIDVTPAEVYMLNGTNAITAPFAGGGFQFKQAAPATDPSDLATFAQIPENAFPSGTRMTFHQAAAPVGWTQDTSLDDAMLRVVAGAGGGTGGSDSAILNDKVPPHTHVTDIEGATHTHGQMGYAPYGLGGGSAAIAGNSASANAGTTSTESSVHIHDVLENPGAANWIPKHFDMIIAEKD
jgi:hypothetical protein